MKFFVIVFFVFISFCSSSSQDVSRMCDEFVKCVGDEASVGINVVNLNNSQVLCSYQPKVRHIPASLMKLATATSALINLGNQYKFQTHVLFNGTIQKFTVDGDIIIEGGGDPTLSSSFFEEKSGESFFECILYSLKEKGVEVINGDIILIDNYFKSQYIPSKRVWEDVANYYGAIPHGLTYKDNSFNLTLKSSEVIGGRCDVINIDPTLDNIIFDCQVLSANNNIDNAYIFGVPELKKWIVRGTIPQNRQSFVIKGANPNPALTMGEELKHFLLRRGVFVRGCVKVLNDDDYCSKGELLITYESPELKEIVKIIIEKSNNLFADHIFLQLDKAKGGFGDWDCAAEQQMYFWNINAGLDVEIVDGSGLSPFNRLSANDLTTILCYALSVINKQEYKTLMAIGGTSGTLKNMWKQYPNKVYGKSGSMNGVLGYAGFVETHNGNEYAFAIIINHSSMQFTEQKKSVESFVSNIICNY
ncbi:MAG: D-alanyl-D-alanine carboxypeptidase/D-alanyl-D-alanine-endopeptidase [Marinilabiliaceae bacterium]|nr:D-alanyl-D-alanine carboxypeptidase/D-alanyl-D-alanine-endopeptidase [Marinilabiliaceae bacterium]